MPRSCQALNEAAAQNCKNAYLCTYDKYSQNPSDVFCASSSTKSDTELLRVSRGVGGRFSSILGV